MRLRLRKPIQALDNLLARQAITQVQMDTFRRALSHLFSRIDEQASEEHQQTIVAGFLQEAFATEHAQSFVIDTHDPIDLVIHARVGDLSSSEVPRSCALIETRRVFASEMMTTLKNNVRALHELIRYAFANSQRSQPLVIRQYIITDAYNWFLFDQHDFQAIFLTNSRLIRLYQLSQQPQKGEVFFYQEVAKILRDLDRDVPVTYLNLREAADQLILPAPTGNQQLLPVYKLLSPEHLLKFPADANTESADHRFYDELLYLIGLREKRQGRPKRVYVERLPESGRQPASLLENTISQLQARNVMGQLPGRTHYGREEADQLFRVGLTLCLTWLSRLLFLHIHAGQRAQAAESPAKPVKSFLSSQSISTFVELNELFFNVTPIPVDERSAHLTGRFAGIPYLNAALFNRSELEQHTITIDALDNQLSLPRLATSVLNNLPTDTQPSPAADCSNTLTYLLNFLSAHAFEPEVCPTVLTDPRPRLTVAKLGRIFERLVSGLTGATPVPPVITSHVVREAIRRTALDRFNAQFGWNCATIVDLTDQLGDIDTDDANMVMNSLRIVDPAVGSGSFLLSALNELVVLKAELGILTDYNGQPLQRYAFKTTGQSLCITQADGEPLDSQPVAHDPALRSERQRVRAAIFHEKRSLLANCLFGVDLDPIAVTVTRLRISLDLLTSFYDAPYAPTHATKKGQSVTFTTLPEPPSFPDPPNLLVGDPLVSRYPPSFRIDALRSPASRDALQSILTRDQAGKLARQKSVDSTASVQNPAEQIGAFVDQLFWADQRGPARIRQLETRLAQSAQVFDFVGQTDKTQRLAKQLLVEKQRLVTHQRLFERAVEWRFTFPAVLNSDGNYVGFDLVLGSLLRLAPEGLPESKPVLRNAFPNTCASQVERYVPMVELGLNLLRPGGWLACLLPDQWLHKRYALLMRRWLRTKALEQLIRVHNTSAASDAVILTVRNRDADDSFRTGQVDTRILEQFGTETDRLSDYLTAHTITLPMAALPDTDWIDLLKP